MHVRIDQPLRLRKDIVGQSTHLSRLVGTNVFKWLIDKAAKCWLHPLRDLKLSCKLQLEKRREFEVLGKSFKGKITSNTQ